VGKGGREGGGEEGRQTREANGDLRRCESWKPLFPKVNRPVSRGGQDGGTVWLYGEEGRLNRSDRKKSGRERAGSWGPKKRVSRCNCQ